MPRAEPSPIYVQAVPKEGPVTRYGTKTKIGCRRDLKDPSILHWTEGEVVAIPFVEFRRHLKEYNRAIRSGALKKVDEKAFKAWQKKEAAAAKKAGEEAKKAKADAKKPTPEKESTERGTAPSETDDTSASE